MNLSGKVVVITGGSRGLGRALGEAFAREGARVVLSSKTKERLFRAAKEVGATAVVADVRHARAMKRLARAVGRKFGRIDVWVNNAGVGGKHMPVEAQDERYARAMIDVNFLGLMFGSQAALLEMKKKKSGTIINILSVRALHAHPLSSAYSATKWAARGFTEALRIVGKEKGIRVIGVYPPGMRTDFFRKKPKGFHAYLDPRAVAGKIVANLKRKKPSEELMI